MSFLRTLCAFLIACVILLLCVHFIPATPVCLLSVLAVAGLFRRPGRSIFRACMTLLIGLGGAAIYGYNGIQAIISGGSIITIILSILWALVFFGGGIAYSLMLFIGDPE